MFLSSGIALRYLSVGLIFVVILLIFANLIKSDSSVLMVVIVFGFTVYTYIQFLPLSQSNIVFSGREMLIYKDYYNYQDEQSGDCDILMPRIENIGKARAEDVKFIIYKMWIDERDICASIDRICLSGSSVDLRA